MFSNEPNVLRALIEQIERPAYVVDGSGAIVLANAAAKADGPPVLPPADRITLRIPHQDGELLIAQPSIPFPLYALKNVVLGFADGVVICEETTSAAGIRRPIVFANPAMSRITGYENQELMGKNPRMFHGPRTAPSTLDFMTKRLNAGQGFQLEVVNYRKNGEEYVADVSVFPLCLSGGQTTHWASIHRDVTLARRHEQLFQEAQRLECMGVLADGIAHDFNNLLTTIMGNAMLLECTVTDPESTNLLHAITSAGSRAAELCRELMAYSGHGELPTQPVNLSALVNESMKLVHFSVPAKATVATELAEVLPVVDVDPVQLRQVVMNLVTNACDALDGRNGTITLRTRHARLDRPLAGCRISSEVPAGDWVELSVADTGSGMSLETQQRLFEPFFTTKKGGHGLGMSAILGIVRRHEGHILCESAPGQGATFRVFLPPAKQLDRLAASADPGLKPSGSGLALIVDDDDEVRFTLASLLEREGYAVVSATSGAAALSLFEERRRELALVMIDYAMPELDGLETVALMRRIATVPTVVITGFDPGKVQLQTQVPIGQPLAFLGKPFSASDVRQAIATMGPAPRSSRSPISS